MFEDFQGSSRDAFLFGIASIPLLLMYVFHLDRIFAQPKVEDSRRRARRAFVGAQDPTLSDPDGRLVVQRIRRAPRLRNLPGIHLDQKGQEPI
jgi:hypothetical protein